MLIAALIAGTALLGLGVRRCAAQFPPPPSATAPAYADDEMTFSIGVFQIVVDTNFAFLFAPSSGFTTYYPGYSPSSGVLTSPVMYDSATQIGTSLIDTYAGNFPATIGLPSGFGAAANYPGNTIQTTSYAPWGGYYGMPFAFAFSTIGFQQVYT